MPTRTNSTARSTVLASLFFALAVFACVTNDEADAPLPAWSVQLHTHGSFSEGMGSIDSHSFEAQALGVDAIWWSDHDFRITSYKHVHHFGFEGASEPIDAQESWKVDLRRHLGDVKTVVAAGLQSGSDLAFVGGAVQGERCLRLRTRHAGADFRSYPCVLAASRKLHRRPLAGGVSVNVSVRVPVASRNARAYLRFLVSEHAPRDGIGLVQYSVRYYLSRTDTEPHREGSTYHVPVPFEAGQWNRIRLPLSADLARGFPSLVASDNALYRVIVGVEARAGAQAEARFDDLVIEHEESGHAMFARQRAVLDEVGRRYPDVRQLQGVEVSFASRHLNEYSLTTDLLDYDVLAAMGARDAADGRFLDEAAFRSDVTRAAVQAAHGRGGLISFNHMFGVALEGSPMKRTRADTLERLRKNRVFGADILEVGYRDRAGASLADHLWVWDQLALSGLRLVGTGVSDTHGGPDERWSGRPNNFVSWIYAAQPTQSHLLDGLSRGRVFFGDIELWDGTLDLVTERGFHMGQELVTDRAVVKLEARVSGHVAGDRLAFFVDGVEQQTHELEAGAQGLPLTLSVPDGTTGTFVRVELTDASGAIKALGNPLYALAQAGGMRAERAAVDIADVRSSDLTGLRSIAIESSPEGLRLGGTGTGGGLTFRVAEPWSGRVRFEGLSGKWQSADGVLSIRNVIGTGTIELLP